MRCRAMDSVTASAIAELTRRVEDLERKVAAYKGRQPTAPRAAPRSARSALPASATPPTTLARAPLEAPMARPRKAAAKAPTKPEPKAPTKQAPKPAPKTSQEKTIDQVLLATWSPPEHAFIPPRTEAEMRLCIRAIHKARGNKLQAAKIVGLPRRTFYRRFDEYGLYAFDWRTDPPTRLPSEA